MYNIYVHVLFTPTHVVYFEHVSRYDFPKFKLLSNKQDKVHAQPPNFKTPLRTEQLRSLEWMLKQEDVNAEPFIEEEISEAVLDPLGWRAEGRAERPVRIRGGVLADQSEHKMSWS